MSRTTDSDLIAALEHAVGVADKRGYPPVPDEWYQEWVADLARGDSIVDSAHDDRSTTARSVVSGALWFAANNAAALADLADEDPADWTGRHLAAWRQYLSRRPVSDVGKSEDLRWEIAAAGQAGDLGRVEELCEQLVRCHRSDPAAVRDGIWNLFLVATAPAQIVEAPPWGGHDWFCERVFGPEVAASFSVSLMWNIVARHCIAHSPSFRIQEEARRTDPIPESIIKTLDLWLSFGTSSGESSGVGDPARAFVAFHLGLASRNPRQFEDAAAMLDGAVASVPSVLGSFRQAIHTGAAACWYNAAMCEKAAESLEQALLLAPSDSVLHLLRTKCFHMLGDSQRMFLAFERYVRDAAPIASDFLSTITLDLGLRVIETEEAQAKFLVALKRQPGFDAGVRVIESLTPEYRQLSVLTKGFWYPAATCFLWEELDPTPRRWARVAQEAGEAVNAELKARVFNDAKDALGAAPSDPIIRTHWKHVRGGKGTLGEHLNFLGEDWLRSQAGAGFKQWLSRRFPPFVKDLAGFRELAWKANNLRGEGGHDIRTTADEAGRAFEAARDALTMLVRLCPRMSGGSRG